MDRTTFESKRRSVETPSGPAGQFIGLRSVLSSPFSLLHSVTNRYETEKLLRVLEHILAGENSYIRGGQL